SGFVFIVWIATNGRESIRREGNEILGSEPPGDIFDIGIQTAVFMHDQHARQLATGIGRVHQVAADVAIALRRGNGGGFRLDPAIIFRDLLGPSEMRAQALEERGGSQATDSKLVRALQELTAVDIAVHILVKHVQQLLWKIARFLAFHGYNSFETRRLHMTRRPAASAYP